MMKRNLLSVVAVFILLANTTAQNDVATFRPWAMTPPMDWNSWDCYYPSVTQKEVMQNAQYLVDNDLVRHGWEYVVIDIRCFCNHPSLGAGNYNQRGDQSNLGGMQGAFDLNARPLSEPAKGLYIQGNKVISR